MLYLSPRFRCPEKVSGRSQSPDRRGPGTALLAMQPTGDRSPPRRDRSVRTMHRVSHEPTGPSSPREDTLISSDKPMPGTDVRFTPLVENNDHEGETWTWWVQVNGNEGLLAILNDVFEDCRSESEYFEEYSLPEWPIGETLTEPEVDLLVRWSDVGYYPAHNKVTGELILPTVFDEATDPFDKVEDLYKGGIDDWKRAG
jgi:hypothetical protein